MSQSRKMSLTEVCCSTAFGFAVALAAQLLVFPLFGICIPLQSNLWLTAIFTIISVLRSYLFRRLFNLFQG